MSDKRSTADLTKEEKERIMESWKRNTLDPAIQQAEQKRKTEGRK